MSNIMLDLETMSTATNAAILTIGAVRFDRKGPMKPIDQMDTFYIRITLSSCKERGLHISEETKKWWYQQSPEAKHEAITHKVRVELPQALTEFANWYKNARRVWSHGDDFDCVILTSAYKACGLSVPWKFWETRDTRTLYDLAGVNLKNYNHGVSHHALHDAYRQLHAAKDSFKKLTLRR